MKWRLLLVAALVGGVAKAELTPAQVAELDKAIVKSDAGAVEKLLGTTDQGQVARILAEIESAQGQAGKYAALAEAVSTKRATAVTISDQKARQLMLQGGLLAVIGIGKTVADFALKTDNASQEGETAGTLSGDITVNAGMTAWGAYQFWCGWNRKEPGVKLSDAQRISALMGSLRSPAAGGDDVDGGGTADDDEDGGAAARGGSGGRRKKRDS